MRRVEDKIRSLCTQVLATDDEDELGPMLLELRRALRQHIEHFRGRIPNYPFLVERRARNEIVRLGPPASRNTANERSATTSSEQAKPDHKKVSRADDSAA